MKLGTFQEQAIPPWTNPPDVVQQQWEQMLAADAYGLDEIWLAEHNGRRYGMGGNVITIASALAGATKRIRIATAITRLPLHNPTHLAEDLAYVDVLSRGRLDWGVGKGYDAVEFGTYGVPYDHREELWRENFDAVRKMWATGRTEFSGKFINLADGELLPMPIQKPNPPIYFMVSGSESSVVWAAQHGLPIAVGSGPGWDDIKARLQMYADVAAKSGFSDERISYNLNNTWQLRQVHVSTNTERAVTEFEKGVMWYFNELGNRAMFGLGNAKQPYEYYVEHSAFLIGSVDKVVNELGEYANRTGINNLICWINVGGQPHMQVLSDLQLLGEEVLPQVRDLGFNWGSGTASRSGQAPTHT